MSEVPAQPSSEPAAAPAPEAPTLDSVYQEFSIEDQASSFQPQSPAPAAQPAAPQAFKAPDPFDPNFGAYQAQLAGGVATLNQALQATRQEVGTLRQQLHSERTEADIKRAVGTIAEKSGLDTKFAEVAFQLKAKEDPRLLAIWNNRGKNPQALSKALEAVAGEFKQTYSVKQDPQLVENQRAVAASRNAMATTQPQSKDPFEGMSYEERRKEMARIRSM